MKRAAVSLLALDPDATAHQPNEALRDGQAEAGASVLPGRRAVGLREFVEDQRLLALGDPDARVSNLKVQLDALSR